MSHQHSNENQARAEYTVLNMVNQPELSTSKNKVLQVLRNEWNQNGRLKFVIIALGIFMSFLVVGLCQEKIMKTPYGDDKEQFTFANTLVEVSLLSGFIFINSEYRKLNNFLNCSLVCVCVIMCCGLIWVINSSSSVI